MNKTNLHVIAFLNIVISSFIYWNLYFLLIESSPSSKGWAQLFSLIGVFIYITNTISLFSLINNFNKTLKYFTIILYLIIPIVALTIEYKISFIPTVILSVIIVLFYWFFIKKTKLDYLIIINGLLFLINIISGIIMCVI